MYAELGRMRQKAKVEWLDKMDTNSAFFHSKVREQHMSCKITPIHNSRGKLFMEIVAEFCDTDALCMVAMLSISIYCALLLFGLQLLKLPLPFMNLAALRDFVAVMV